MAEIRAMSATAELIARASRPITTVLLQEAPSGDPYQDQLQPLLLVVPAATLVVHRPRGLGFLRPFL